VFNSVTLVASDRLRVHERINEAHLLVLLRQIASDGFIDEPLIVDENTLIILDGHHRYTAAQRLGLKLLPVCFVDYRCSHIKVFAWRAGERVTKAMVIRAGLQGKLLKPKTSRHLISNKPCGLKISLNLLK